MDLANALFLFLGLNSLVAEIEVFDRVNTVLCMLRLYFCGDRQPVMVEMGNFYGSGLRVCSGRSECTCGGRYAEVEKGSWRRLGFRIWPESNPLLDTILHYLPLI